MIHTFTVYGIPKPQGSKRAFVAGGKAVMTEAGGKEHAAWRNAVAEKAAELAAQIGTLAGPLRVDVIYHFPMPRSRSKTTRERGWSYHTVAPDLDKLNRTIGDALQAGGLIANDSQICASHSVKIETAQWSGAEIAVKGLS